MAAHRARRVFRGVRAQVLTKLLRSLELVNNMDFREMERSTLDNRMPDLFAASTPIENAIARIRNQAQELKAFKR